MNRFAILIFLGSAQLFFIQPMFAKRLLPILGGAPSVWNACMLFYQTTLLAGYAYAHWLSKCRLKMQLAIHACLVLVPLFVLIAGPPHWIAPNADEAVQWLILYLLTSVGLPFFVLSANAPLMQKWFANCLQGAKQQAYFLYSASNLGSFCALIAYPTLIEPQLTLADQYNLLRVLYEAYLLIMVSVIAKTWNDGSKAVESPSKIDESTAISEPEVAPIDLWHERGKWMFLSFIPSSLLLSVTTYVTSNIAPCPLFWVIPLGLYLLTFVIAFSSRRLIPEKWIINAHAFLLTALCTVLFWKQIEFNYLLVFPLHLITFFVCALLCHSQLVSRRPSVSRLTEFYLCLSIGGALGGMFNTLIAPMIFKSLIEYPAVLAISCLARPATTGMSKEDNWRRGGASICFSLLGIAILYALSKTWTSQLMDYRLPLVLLPAALGALSAAKRPVFMLACITAMLFVGTYMWKPSSIIFEGRNFFGNLSVCRDSHDMDFLVHGNILHGVEDMKGKPPHEPLTYYHHDSPIGKIFSVYDSQWQQANIAVVGLGAGSLAAYAQPGQHWTFYEINPLVVDIASNQNFFTYLEECRSPKTIVVGDGRQSLLFAPDNSFSLIVLDAFSSDSIPVHLLTREAIQMYLTKLTSGGILAFHISTHNLNLVPNLRELARNAGLSCLVQEGGHSSNSRSDHKFVSRWFVMARTAEVLSPLKAKGFSLPDAQPSVSLWTDDFSNLLETLRID